MTNVIPFGKHTLEKLRARNIARLAPPERSWLFNCFTHDGAIKPWPDKLVSLPPVPADRHDSVRLTTEELFQFRPNPRYKPATDAAITLAARDTRALESDLENVLLQYKFEHPGLLPLDLVPVMLGIVKKLLRQAQLPPR